VLPSRHRSTGTARCQVYLREISKEAEAAKAALVARDGEPSAELKLNQDFPFARQQEQGLFVEAFRKLGLPVCLKREEAAKLTNPQRLPECVTS
jgi:hypothetical protein